MPDSTLDLRWQAPLSGAIADQYDRLAASARSDFTEMLVRVSETRQGDIAWWMSTPSTRNQSVSRLFHFCIALLLLRELIDTRRVPVSVLVDTANQGALVKDVLDRYGLRAEVRVAPLRPAGEARRLRRFLSPYRAGASAALNIALVRATSLRIACRRPAGTVTLLDTYKLPGYNDTDPYYSGLWERLSAAQRKAVWYVPHFHGFGVRDLWRCVRQLRQSERNYLFKEDFLRIADIWFALRTILKIEKIRVSNARFRDWDVGPLVQDELRFDTDFRAALWGMLNFRFPVRLQGAGVSVRRAIDWYENQLPDRGWNAGFRRAYPDADLVGYQGTHAAYQSIKPTRAEYSAGVLPKVLAVMGSGYIQDRREFFSGMPITVAPAFRYQWLWKAGRLAPRANTVLVALPIDESGSLYLLDLLGAVCRRLPRYHFWIKAHPASQIDVPMDVAGMEPVEGSLEEWLFKASTAVCGGLTTASLETMACGVPTVVVPMPGRVWESPLPSGLPEGHWRVCRDADALCSALIDFQNERENPHAAVQKQSQYIKERYFCPVTAERIAEFLGFSGDKVRGIRVESGACS